MQKLCIFLLFHLFIFHLRAGDVVPPEATLTGKIADKNTGEPLAGAVIYFPDLKTGTASDADGRYKIESLPRTKVLVQVSLIGYRTIIQTIDLAAISEKDFALEYTATELNEVVVTGLSKAAEQKRTPTPISVVSKTSLLENSSTNIIDAVTNQPGVSQITTGAGISKPVIRGLGYNRVVVVNDGIRQEGQQWGDEHGVEVDEFAVNKVEILKGPASLTYGSDAMAGVVNMLSAPGLPNGKIEGSLATNYQTNNGLVGYSADFAGNRHGFVWDLRYSNKLAHAYKNKYDGYVFNSGFREHAFSGLIGLNKSWGYSNLILGAYTLVPGIVEGERDSISGRFVKPVALHNGTEGREIATDADFTSYGRYVPYQLVHHYKALLTNSIYMGDGSLNVTLGYQQNIRQEYADVLNPNDYGLYFRLHTLNYDVRYNFPEKKNWDVSVGVNGMQQTSLNKGTEFLVPAYSLFDGGAFAVVKKAVGQLDISAGLRYDIRNEHGKDLYLNSEGIPLNIPVAGSVHRFAAFNSVFSGISGSAGATFQISKALYTKLNISRGFRAPNIGELGANGVHEGTLRYELGDPALKAESSLQLDYSFGWNSEHISAEINLFDNSIHNFIFLHKLTGVAGADSISDGVSTFKYVSGKAHLVGGEIRFDVHPHPLDWIHVENAFSYVLAQQANQPDSARYLPLIPAPRLQSGIKFEAKKLGRWLQNAYVRFDVDNYLRQDKVYSAFGTETPTPGYTLVSIGLGSDFIRKGKTRGSLYISIANATDEAYQSHLSRLKYAPENYVTGRQGIFNMGRNVSFKLIVPIDFE